MIRLYNWLRKTLFGTPRSRRQALKQPRMSIESYLRTGGLLLWGQLQVVDLEHC
jgi:hypothetical protein